jgi:hypothetical protein
MITAIVTAIGIGLMVSGGALAGWAINIPEPDSPAQVRLKCRLRARRYIQDAA